MRFNYSTIPLNSFQLKSHSVKKKTMRFCDVGCIIDESCMFSLERLYLEGYHSKGSLKHEGEKKRYIKVQ